MNPSPGAGSQQTGVSALLSRLRRASEVGTNMRLWSRSRVERYLIVGLLSLLAFSLLQWVIGLPGVPEVAQLPGFYLLVPGWTLLLTSAMRLKGPLAAPLGWLMVTGFSWLVWFLAVVCVVEGSRWARRCFALRREPVGITRLVITCTIAAVLVGVSLWPLETTVVSESPFQIAPDKP
jgi:hypothetical protein